jgi:hypothetical protein
VGRQITRRDFIDGIAITAAVSASPRYFATKPSNLVMSRERATDKGLAQTAGMLIHEVLSRNLRDRLLRRSGRVRSGVTVTAAMGVHVYGGLRKTTKAS